MDSSTAVEQLSLTHLCRLYFPILINWTSPFPILGFLGGIFHLYSNFKRKFYKPDQTSHFAASDLAFHFLMMFYKKDARLIWVKRALKRTVVCSLWARR